MPPIVEYNIQHYKSLSHENFSKNFIFDFIHSLYFRRYTAFMKNETKYKRKSMKF